MSDVAETDILTGTGEIEGEISPDQPQAPVFNSPARAIAIVSLSNIKVWIKNNPEISARTDLNGKFTLKKAPKAEKGEGHTIEYEKTEGSEIFKGIIKDVPVVENKKISLNKYIGKVVIKKTGAVQGKLVLSDSMPPLGSEVYIPGISGMISKVDDDGSFSVIYIPEGTFNLVFQARNYETVKKEITLTAGEIKQLDTVVLRNITSASVTSSVEGYVSDDTGVPAGGALISLVSYDSAVDMGTITTVNGHYEFKGLNSGTYEVIFLSENFKGTRETVILSPGETKNLNMSLSRLQSQSLEYGGAAGYIKDLKTSTPISNAIITTIPPTTQYFSDMNGFVSFSLPVGDYSLVIKKAGYIEERISLNISAARSNEFASSLESRASEQIASIGLNKTFLEIKKGQSFQFLPLLKDSDENVIYGRPVSWSSSDETVGFVTSNGYFTANGAGECVIYAQVDGIKAEAAVAVGEDLQKMLSLKVFPQTVSMNIDEIKRFNLFATYEDGQVRAVSGSLAEWSHNGGAALSMIEKSAFMAISEGTYKIYAGFGSFTAEAGISVNKASLEDLIPPQINHRLSNISVGSDFNLAAEVTDNISVAKVTLGYKKPQDASYAVAEMQSDGSGRYSYTIAKENITSAGILYYIQAEDSRSPYPNKTSFPASGEIYPIALKPVSLSELILSRTADKAQYKTAYDLSMISASAKYSDASLRSVSPEWLIVSGGGSMNGKLYTPLAAAGEIKLKAVYSENGATAETVLTLIVEKNPFIGEVLPAKGWTAKVYRLNYSLRALPDFLNLGEPISEFRTPEIKVEPVQFDIGFGGMAKDLIENFAIRYTGKLVIAEQKEYTFKLSSDDGSKLYIDGQLIIDNDGAHQLLSKTGSISLSRGEHTATLDYFQGARYGVALKLLWNASGAEEIIPQASVSEWSSSKTPSELTLSKTSDIIGSSKTYDLKTISCSIKYSDGSSAPVTPGWSINFGGGLISDGKYYAADQPSSVLSASYTENGVVKTAMLILTNASLSTVSAPAFSLTSGIYVGQQTVELSCATPGAVIYYTLDGSAPGKSSSIYSNSLKISSTVTLKAVAMKDGMLNSPSIAASYTITSAASQNSQIYPLLAMFDKNPSFDSDITVSVVLNSNSLIAIKNGGVTLGAEFDYVAATNSVIIKKAYLEKLETGVASLAFIFSSGANQVLSVNITNSAGNSTISPVSASFDKNAAQPSDLTFSMVLKGNVLTAVKNSSSQLAMNTDYAAGADTLIIKKEYLLKQPAGALVLTFEFSAGANFSAVVNISDSSLSHFNSIILPASTMFDKNFTARADINLTLILNGNSLLAVKNNNTAMSPNTDYIAATNSVTIKKEFLSALPAGNNAVRFEFSAGDTQFLNVNVIDSTGSSINPSSAAFNKKTTLRSDIAVSVPEGGISLSSIKNGTVELILNSNYLKNNNIITLKQDYLAALPLGPSTIAFNFSNGTVQNFSVNVIDTTDSIISPSFASFDKNLSAQSDINITMLLNANSLAAIKNGLTALIYNSHYYSSNNIVTIKKEYLSSLSEGVNSLKFEFSAGASQLLVINVADTTIKEITPSSVSFDKKVQNMLDITLSIPYGKTISAIINNTRLLKNETDYIISGSFLTLKKDYFATLEVGLQVLSCVFTNGAVQSVAVNVINTNNSSINPSAAIFDKYFANQNDIAVKMELYANRLNYIKNATANNILSNITDYTTSESGLAVIKKEYLFGRPLGSTKFEFYFDSGAPQTLSVSIIDSAKAAAPVFSVSGGAYDEPQKIYITSETPNALIYYTLDGSAPTTASSLYTGSLEIQISSTLKAIVFKPGMTVSIVSQAAYTINKLPAPELNIAGGTIIPMNGGSAGNEGNMFNVINSKLAAAADRKIKFIFKNPPLPGILTLSMSDDDNFPARFATFQANSDGTTAEILFTLFTGEINLRRILGDEDITGLNLKVKLVSFTGTESVYAVKKKMDWPIVKYEAPKWQYLGSGAVSDSTAGTCSVYVHDSVPYIAYADSLRGNKVTVKKYIASSGSWATVGAPGFTSVAAANLSLKFFNGSPLLVYSSAAGSGEIYLMKLNGSSWEQLSGGSPGYSYL